MRISQNVFKNVLEEMVYSAFLCDNILSDLFVLNENIVNNDVMVS